MPKCLICGLLAIVALVISLFYAMFQGLPDISILGRIALLAAVLAPAVLFLGIVTELSAERRKSMVIDRLTEISAKVPAETFTAQTATDYIKEIKDLLKVLSEMTHGRALTLLSVVFLGVAGVCAYFDKYPPATEAPAEQKALDTNGGATEGAPAAESGGGNATLP